MATLITPFHPLTTLTVQSVLFTSYWNITHSNLSVPPWLLAMRSHGLLSLTHPSGQQRHQCELLSVFSSSEWITSCTPCSSTPHHLGSHLLNSLQYISVLLAGLLKDITPNVISNARKEENHILRAAAYSSFLHTKPRMQLIRRLWKHSLKFLKLNTGKGAVSRRKKKTSSCLKAMNVATAFQQQNCH